jgi:hypothetical protein
MVFEHRLVQSWITPLGTLDPTRTLLVLGEIGQAVLAFIEQSDFCRSALPSFDLDLERPPATH